MEKAKATAATRIKLKNRRIHLIRLDSGDYILRFTRLLDQESVEKWKDRSNDFEIRVINDKIGITEITISKEALYSVSALISNEILNTNPDSVEL